MEATPLYFVWEYTDVDRDFWAEHLADWLPDRIVDSHTHVNDSKFCLEETTEEMRKQYWVNEFDCAISAADADRCHKTLFPGKDMTCVAMGLPTLTFDIDASNADLRQQAAKYGWRSLVVTRPQWSAERIAEELDRPGVIGMKVYYSLIDHDPTTRDKHIEASTFDFVPHHQLEVLNAKRGWLTLHVSRAGRLPDPDNIREVKEIREKYPDITLVIAHLGRCYTLYHAKQALAEFADDDGLYFDNSAVMNPEVHRYAIETLGAQRILYGTDNPIFYMRGRRQWGEKSYVNRTNHPFHFNKDREPAEVEAGYTLYTYEAIKAIKDACEAIGAPREDIDAIFHANADRLLASLGTV